MPSALLTTLLSIANLNTGLFPAGKAAGAKVFSNSWGAAATYNYQASRFWHAAWKHKLLSESAVAPASHRA
jgi:hypothetical protein